MGRYQRGLTLLEVLIALSIFSLIGLASYRVLTTVVNTEETSGKHSQQLAQFQRALMIVDKDLQQIVMRDIRVKEQFSKQKNSSYLKVKQGEYLLEFTRGGRSNPLLLPRSTLQRIAYDVGLHPQVANAQSRFYGDPRSYLRRHMWTALDRDSSAAPVTQALLVDVKDFSVSVISSKGRSLIWPPISQNNSTTKSKLSPLALELSLVYANDIQLSRLYQVM